MGQWLWGKLREVNTDVCNPPLWVVGVSPTRASTWERAPMRSCLKKTKADQMGQEVLQEWNAMIWSDTAALQR